MDDDEPSLLWLETLLPVCIASLIEPGHLTWPQLVSKLTVGPARLLDLEQGTLAPGADADVTIIDPNLTWTVDAVRFASKSRNTPFHGQTLRGRARYTIVAGEVRYRCRAT